MIAALLIAVIVACSMGEHLVPRGMHLHDRHVPEVRYAYVELVPMDSADSASDRLPGGHRQFPRGPSWSEAMKGWTDSLTDGASDRRDSDGSFHWQRRGRHWHPKSGDSARPNDTGDAGSEP